MERRGYDGYRGRTRAQNVVRTVIGIVVIVLVLVIVGLLLGQRYIVYTDDGIRLEIPFLQQEPAASADVGDVSVEIVHKPEPKPAVPKASVPARAVFLKPDELENGGPEAADTAGANTVVVDMKGRDGALGFTDGTESRVRAGIEQLHRADKRVVARVFCFRDDILGRQSEYALVTNSGYLWNYDDQGLYWINPGLESVRQHVAGIVGDLARLGFDEILLEDWGYPAQGEVGWIRRDESYDPAQLHAAVDRFVELAQQELEGTETLLSLSVYGSVLEGTDTLSGRTLTLLERLDGRVWLQGEDVQTLENLISRTLLKLEQVVWPVQAYAENDRNQYLAQ